MRFSWNRISMTSFRMGSSPEWCTPTPRFSIGSSAPTCAPGARNSLYFPLAKEQRSAFALFVMLRLGLS